METNHAIEFIKVNMDNKKLSDEAFRELVRSVIDLTKTSGGGMSA